MRRKGPLTPAQKYRVSQLSFKVDRPENRYIVEFFLCAITEEGKITVPVKHYAFRQWGFHDACAGMMRAFRVFRRTHHWGFIRQERLFQYGDKFQDIYGFVKD
jgi:hypothetical protein